MVEAQEREHAQAAVCYAQGSAHVVDGEPTTPPIARAHTRLSKSRTHLPLPAEAPVTLDTHSPTDPAAMPAACGAHTTARQHVSPGRLKRL